MTTISSDHLQDLNLQQTENEDSLGEASDDDEGTSLSDQESNLEDVSESERNTQQKHDSSSSSSMSRSNSNSNIIDDEPRRRKIFRRRRRREKIRRALVQLRSKLEDALEGNFLIKQDQNQQKQGSQNFKDLTLWGIPLLPSKGHEGTDIILLKFLKAQSYKADNALENLRETLQWRETNGIDQIMEENLGDGENDLDKVVFVESVDKDGHPLCFNLYGAFKDRALYDKTFGTEQNRREFLRWRIQFMEKSIKKLDLKPGGVNSFLLISDMKNVPGPGHRVNELGPISKDAVSIFQHYYPELICKHIIINAPFWYYLYHGVIAQYCTNGTKRKFLFTRPNRVTETLLKYIPPQNIPIQYGGLRRENDDEFTSEDKVVKYTLRGGVSTFQIPVPEGKATLVWETMVVGWDVTYKDEFIPDDEGSYKILLQKEKKIVESMRNSFYIHEPGKILISIKNATYGKKRVFIRHKSKITLPVYMSSVINNNGDFSNIS